MLNMLHALAEILGPQAISLSYEYRHTSFLLCVTLFHVTLPYFL